MSSVVPSRRGRSVWAAALSASVLSASPALAQLGFTEYAVTDSTLNSSPNTDFWIASAAPADVDQDGDLDLLVAGYYVVYPNSTNPDGSAEDRLVLYRNDGAAGPSTWALTPIAVSAAGLSFGTADLAWGDVDNDGDPDVVVAGDGAMKLYRNDGGTLVPTATALPEYWEDSDFMTFDLRSLTWADQDNDGDLDLLVPSVPDAQGFGYGPTLLLRNDGPAAGGAWTFTDVSAGLPPTSNGVSAWADADGDGDLDLLLGNISPWGDSFLSTHRNDGGTLVPQDAGLAFISYGTADWGDADGDGDLDIVYAGNIELPDGTGETVVRVLFAGGASGYVPLTVVAADFSNPNEPWLDFSAATWADYDSDGDIDLLISGEWLGDGEIFGRSVVYANDAGTFTLAGQPLPAPVAGNAGGAFTWFDVDGDGDLDYFVAGGYYVPNGNGLIEARTQLFRNDAPAANAAPAAPAGLQATVDAGGAVALAWNAATDDSTPQAALTYQLELTAAPGLSRSSVTPSATTIATTAAEHALPEPGSVSGNTSWTVHGLADGNYTWTVRALDSAFNASAIAQGTFAIGNVASDLAVRPRPLALSAASPNPFNPSTRLMLTLGREQHVTVALYAANGRRIGVLLDGTLPAGDHAVPLQGIDLASGSYFVRATGPDGSAVRRVTLVR